MERVGVIKAFDRLGRLVIPKELRDRYGLFSDVEIVATEEGILIRNPEYRLIKCDRLAEEKRIEN